MLLYLSNPPCVGFFFSKHRVLELISILIFQIAPQKRKIICIDFQNEFCVKCKNEICAGGKGLNIFLPTKFRVNRLSQVRQM